MIAPKHNKTRAQETMTTTSDFNSNDNGECVVQKLDTGKHKREKYVLLPEKFIHKRNSETFIYDSRTSPLSNIHPTPFTVEGQTYSCNRQYIEHQKALLFEDWEAARKILNTTDPDEISRIPIKGFRREKWEQHEEHIMIDAAIHKFSKNNKLMELLFRTSDLLLGNMGSNLRYGTGMMIDSDDALNRNKWPGHNREGKAVMAARDILRSQDKIASVSVVSLEHFRSEPLDKKQWLNAKKQGQAILETNNLGSETAQSSDVLHDDLEINDTEIELKHRAEDVLKRGPTNTIFTKYIFLPEKCVHKKDSCTLVFGILSPLSNLYPAEFIVNGQTYICALQYTEHQKALLFGDEENIRKIFVATYPEEIEIYKSNDGNKEKLEQHEEQILFDAALHKFRYFPKLKKLLLRTGDLPLGFVIADIRYGTGVKMSSARALDRNLWAGENRCGRALMQAREILKKETREETSSKLNTSFYRVTPSSDSELTYQCVDYEKLDKWEPGQCIPVPEKYLHRQDKENFLYHGELSPFSTFYPAPFTVDGQAYSCAMQYIEHQKALLSRDEETAEKILQTTEPAAEVFKVKGFSKEEWKHFERNILICAAIYKFSQNEKLKELLLNTDDLHFGCMARNLRLGTGTLLHSDMAFDRKSWPGKNTNGEVLVVTRDLLRMGDNIFKEKTNSALYNCVEDYVARKDSVIRNPVEEPTTKTNNNLETHHQGLSEKCLPVCEKLVHKQDSDTLVFCATYSPFSDFHPAPFTVDGQRFSYAAQYIMYHKALLFGDVETVEKILKSRDPEEMTTNKVYDFKPEKWMQCAETTMKDAAFHKFSQNLKLKKLLLRTDDLHLGEAQTNTFYGTGVRFDKTKALDRENWTGENIAGKALMAARDTLRKQEAMLIAPEGRNCAEDVPEGCVPVWEYWIHKWNSETFIYDSRMSPFSDMHPAPFTVDEQMYSCRVQYILHQKALLLGDHEAADKILKATNPDEMQQIPCEAIKIRQWKQREGRIMIFSAVYMFSQNEKLKKLLLDTGDLYLGCTGWNVRYGTGMVINAKGALNRKQWTGQNMSGESLMAARNILRKQSVKH